MDKNNNYEPAIPESKPKPEPNSESNKCTTCQLTKPQGTPLSRTPYCTCKTEEVRFTLADTLAIKDATQNMQTTPSTTSGYSQASASSAGSNSKIARVKHICLEEKIIVKYPSDILKKRQISHIQDEMAGGKTSSSNCPTLNCIASPSNLQSKLKSTNNSSDPSLRPVSPLIPLDTDAEIQHKEQYNKSYDVSLISMSKSSQQVQITKLSPRDPKQVSSKKLGE